MNNLSLILFTILIQGSTGLFIIKAIWNFKKTGSLEMHKNEYRVVFISLILAFGGMISSFTHLGSPGNSFYSLKNIGSSWMSREILVLIIYQLSLLILILIRNKLFSSKLIVLFRNLSFFAAALLLFSMIKVYSIPGLLNLEPVTVFISFFCTSIFLGGSLLVILNIREHEKSGNMLFLAGIALMISFLNYIASPIINPLDNQIFMLGAGSYILSFFCLIPALIPKFKNIYTPSAVIFIILGLLSEFFNRLILLSFTSYSI